MDLVRQQIDRLQDTHGTESPTLTFTGGSLQAVRPEENSDVVSGRSIVIRVCWPEYSDKSTLVKVD
jgi:hypothetical protein